MVAKSSTAALLGQRRECQLCEVAGDQGSKWDGMRRYAIPALPWTGRNHTVTSFPRTIIPLCLHEIFLVDSQENCEYCCHRMSFFKVKRAQNSISTGAVPQPGEFTLFPQTPWLDLRGPTSKGRGKEVTV